MDFVKRSKVAWAVIFCLIALLLPSLACRATSSGPIDAEAPLESIDSEEGVSPTTILSVSVNPPAGAGDFSLEVKYRVGRSALMMNGESIICNYAGADDATMEIGTFFPAVPNFSAAETDTMSGTKPFTETKAGDYTATCQSASGRSQASAPFTVKNAITGSGQRVWDGLYTEADPNVFLVSHCASPVSVKLELRPDGTAWMQTLGEGRYGAKCESNYRLGENTRHIEWTLTGVYDPATETATFTDCNNTPRASGQVSYKDRTLNGAATCIANTDPKLGELKVTITIP